MISTTLLLGTDTKEQGYTILEVLVSVVILAVVISFSSTSVVTHLGANHKAVVRSEAAQAAQTVLDDLRTVDVPSLRATGTDAPVDIKVNANRDYTVLVEYCKNATYCTSTEARHLSVEVSYNGEVVYNTETVFTGIADTSAGGGTFNSGGGCWMC